MICNSFPAAIESIYKHLFCERNYLKDLEVEAAAVQMGRKYFHDAKCKQQFMEILRRFGLEENAIEAEAFRLAGVDLERIDKMLCGAERRRDKLLRFIGRYRKSLATHIRQVRDRIIAEAEGPRPEPSTDGADCGE